MPQPELVQPRAIHADDDLIDDPVAELRAIERELQRRRWLADPDSWARERLGVALWSRQRRIAQAVAQHRKTLAMSCHGVGKSFDAALIACWWIDVHPLGSAFVVTSAPSQPQVEAILWKEMRRLHTKGKLAGRMNQTEWYITINGKEELVAMGRKPSDYNPMSFQGFHARYVLVIFDEGPGIRGYLWDAADALISNDESKLFTIGNPDDPQSEFCMHAKPNSGWHVEQIGAFDSPNFTGEAIDPDVARELIGKVYVEERRAKWAPAWRWSDDGSRVVPPEGAKIEDTHPFWQSKILGQFPVQTVAGTLIPLAWIRAAQLRQLATGAPNELGLDVGASEDGDPSCLGYRQGSVFRILYEERQPDTMQTTGKLIQHLRDARLGATCAKVDYIGVGRGVVDRAREQQLPVYPISVGEAGTITSCLLCRHEWDVARTQSERCPKCNSHVTQKVFANLLSQLWWDVRVRFEQGDIDIDAEDEELAEQLLMMRWEPNSKGQTVVKYNDGPSPNRADALLITFAPLLSSLTFDYHHSGLTSSVTW